ncbi:MAG: carbohydrate kinase family protein [Clostridiales bacterium]|nr:carbohydrate kinase family protein [Clostridiales bacterium]
MKRFDYTVIGTAATVSVYKVKQMPTIGRSVAIENDNYDEIYHGGMAFNICCALARLGVRIYPVLTYADARQAEVLRDFVRRYGLPGDGIQDPPPGSNGTTIMIQDEQKNHMTMVAGYNRRMPGSAYYAPQIMEEGFFRDSRMAILCAPMAMNTRGILDAIRRHRIPLAFSMRRDPYAFPKDLLREILLHAQIVFSNEDEAEFICEEYGLRAVTDLFDRGNAELIATTLGAAGSVVYRKRGGAVEQMRVDITPATAAQIDTVGAGDGYVSGFLYAYARGMDAATCARLGSTLSSFVIEKDGSTTNLPDADALMARYSTRLDVKGN